MFLGALISAVGSFISTVSSAISSLASSVGKVICEGASKLVTTIGKIGQIMFPDMKIFDILLKVGEFIGKVAEFLDLKKPGEDDAEELGMKAEMSDKKMEDFDTTEEYINHLHNNVQIDKEKMKNLSEEERAAYTAVGSTIYTKGVAEKIGVGEFSAEMMLDAVKLGLTAKEVITLVKELKTAGFETQAEMSNYLHLNTKDMSSETIGKMQGILHTVIKESNPNISDEKAAERVLDMQDTIRGKRNNNREGTI